MHAQTPEIQHIRSRCQPALPKKLNQKCVRSVIVERQYRRKINNQLKVQPPNGSCDMALEILCAGFTFANNWTVWLELRLVMCAQSQRRRRQLNPSIANKCHIVHTFNTECDFFPCSLFSLCRRKWNELIHVSMPFASLSPTKFYLHANTPIGGYSVLGSSTYN